MKTRANVIIAGRYFARQGVASSDPRNAALAQLLWQNATVSQTWLDEQLGMRSAANVSQAPKQRCSGPARAVLIGSVTP